MSVVDRRSPSRYLRVSVVLLVANSAVELAAVAASMVESAALVVVVMASAALAAAAVASAPRRSSLRHSYHRLRY